MRILLLILISSIYSVLPICGQNAIFNQCDERPFKDKEELHYRIHYSATFIRAAVADAVLSVDEMLVDGSKQYQFKGYGKTRPFFNLFYKLEDTYISNVDSNSLKPQSVKNYMREGGYVYNQIFNFDWSNGTVKTFGHNVKRDAKYEKSMPLLPRSFDGLSLFYNLRCLELKDIKDGEKFNMDLVLEDTIRNITMRFKGREELYVENLGKFKTMRFDCQFATSTEDAFDDGDEFFLWITDDKNKIPVYLKSPIKVGSLAVTLTSWKGLTHPLYIVLEDN